MLFRGEDPQGAERQQADTPLVPSCRPKSHCSRIHFCLPLLLDFPPFPSNRLLHFMPSDMFSSPLLVFACFLLSSSIFAFCQTHQFDVIFCIRFICSPFLCLRDHKSDAAPIWRTACYLQQGISAHALLFHKHTFKSHKSIYTRHPLKHIPILLCYNGGRCNSPESHL